MVGLTNILVSTSPAVIPEIASEDFLHIRFIRQEIVSVTILNPAVLFAIINYFSSRRAVC